MTQHSGNAVALTTEATREHSARGKRIAQMVGAAALSFGMVGAFSLPAYAAPDEGDLESTRVTSEEALQSLSLEEAGEAAPVVEEVTGKVDSEIRAAEKAEAAEKLAEEEALNEQEDAEDAADSSSSSDAKSSDKVPSGEGAQGIADAALAQLGVSQDCTALVEKSLRAVGIPAGDLGTRAAEYVALGGTQVSAGSYQVGDVLIYEGNHVAIYVGNGRVVHGGWDGFTTVVAGTGTYHGQPTSVVRF